MAGTKKLFAVSHTVCVFAFIVLDGRVTLEENVLWIKKRKAECLVCLDGQAKQVALPCMHLLHCSSCLEHANVRA